MTPFVKDPNSGSPSPALTVLVMTVTVALTKLLVSGMHVGQVVMGTFTGTEFAAVVASGSALYAAVQHSALSEKEDK